jgi:hypothetical protein
VQSLSQTGSKLRGVLLGPVSDRAALLCAQVAIPWERPFEARHIKSMELVVLATLEWRVAAVTAASFLDRLLLGAFEAATLDDPSALHAARSKSMGLLARTLPGARATQKLLGLSSASGQTRRITQGKCTQASNRKKVAGPRLHQEKVVLDALKDLQEFHCTWASM